MTSRRHCKHCLACGVPFWPGPYFAEEGPPRALKVISNGGDLKLFSRSRWVRTAASEKVRLHPNPTGFDAPADIIIFENEFGLLQIDGRPSLLSRSLYEITSCRLYGLKNFSLPTTLPFYCFCSVFQSFPLGESDDRSPVGPSGFACCAPAASFPPPVLLCCFAGEASIFEASIDVAGPSDDVTPPL